MKWTKQYEELAKIEYLSMIDTLKNTDEFNGEWKGKWDSFEKETFGGRKAIIKGDKEKYMNYWIENQKIINDNDWDKINNLNDEHF